MSTGPTSIIGLLTADIVKDFVKEGYAPEVIASAIAFMIGIYSAVLGFLKLGWLLDFISTPVLNGFVSAAALVILLGQVPSLLGEDNVGSGTAATIHDVPAQIGQASPITIAVGLSGIVLLELLAFAGKRWGKKNKIIWFLSICRAAIALLIFTGISFALNRNRQDDPLFDLAKVKADGIVPPKAPDFGLVEKVVFRSIAPFIAAALEHIAIGKAFAAKNDYVLDESQELCYLAVINVSNSFFSAMGVGGAMSRTAVNSESGVKSPLSGLLTSGFVILSIYKLTGALFWIPKATLAAIIITAVFHLIGPISKFYYFWRISFLDFAASMIAFWTTLFLSAEYGIGAAVAFSIACSLVYSAFARVSVTAHGISHIEASRSARSYDVPRNTKVFFFTEAITFPNANRVSRSMMDTIRTYHCPCKTASYKGLEDRNWSVSGERRIMRLRKKAGMRPSQNLPPVNLVVLDFTAVTYTDVSGVYTLREFDKQLKKFAGEHTVQLRFVGMNERVRKTFRRAAWEVVDWPILGEAQTPVGATLMYASVSAALADADITLGEQADDLYDEIMKS